MKSNNGQPSIIRKAQHTIDKFNMIKKGDRVLVAFSGGPDSCALLLLLDQLKGKYGFSLCAGHVNHMLRGKESSKDEQWVKKTCEDLKIPCKIVKKNINKLKKKGESLEEAARRIRYEALGKIAKDFKANKIAFGHNRNDQIETILFRIIRGAGEDGLSGIPASRDLPAPTCPPKIGRRVSRRSKQAGLNRHIKIIRPLLETERGEIDKYLQAKNIKPRIDSSNLDIKFFRNKIRHELIPYLEKFNPKIQEGLLKIGQISRENSEYIKLNTRKILKNISMRMRDEVKIDIDKLKDYPRILRGNILREFAKDFKGLDYANLKEIEKIIDSKRANLAMRLPPGIEIAKEYTNLFIRKIKTSKKPACNKNYSYTFKKEGKRFIPEAKKNVSIDISKKNKKTALKFDDSNQTYFDADKIKFPLTIRNRKKGDRFCPFGMKKEKKLKDFFIDQKVPIKERNSVPILVAEDGKILWIVGYRRSNLGIITKNTSKVMRIIVR